MKNRFSFFMALGIVAGTAAGVAVHNIPMGIVAGLPAGIVFAFLNNRASEN